MIADVTIAPDLRSVIAGQILTMQDIIEAGEKATNVLLEIKSDQRSTSVPKDRRVHRKR